MTKLGQLISDLVSHRTDNSAQQPVNSHGDDDARNILDVAIRASRLISSPEFSAHVEEQWLNEDTVNAKNDEVDTATSNLRIELERLRTMRPGPVGDDVTAKAAELLASARKIAPPYDWVRVESAAFLASVLCRLDRHGDAVAVLRETIDEFQRVVGPTNCQHAFLLGELANTLRHIPGSLQESVHLARQACSIVTIVLGINHFQRVLVAESLADAYLAAGQAAEAELLLREVLPVACAQLRRTDARLARMKFKLVRALLALRRSGEAEEGLADALQDQESLTPASTRLIAEGHLLRGQALGISGRAEDALREYEQGLSAYQSGTSAAAAEIAAAQTLVGGAHLDLGQTKLAEAHFIQAIESQNRLNLRSTVSYAATLGMLAALMLRTGRSSDASRCFEQAATVHAIVAGPDHPDQAAYLNNLGAAKLQAGDHHGAQAALDRAQQILAASDRQAWVIAGLVKNNCALLKERAGEHIAAAHELENALHILFEAGELAGAAPFAEGLVVAANLLRVENQLGRPCSGPIVAELKARRLLQAPTSSPPVPVLARILM